MADAKRVVREECCRRLSGLSRSTRWRLEREGKFPHRLRLSANTVGWLEDEILAWLRERAQLRGSTPPPQPRIEGSP
jgi:prophage regulatory protein